MSEAREDKGTQDRDTTPPAWVGVGALLAITILAYLPALRAGFIWDDDQYVTQNAALRTPHGLADAWIKPGSTPQYYPLVFSTFWVEYHIWGLWPLGYHLVNVALHGLNAVLLWFVLRRLAVPGAWLAAAIFAVHPAHVESVAWVTERKNVLSGAFYLSVALAYLRFCHIDLQAAPRSYKWGFYVCAVLLFACALLSKTVTCSLPAAILLLLWWKRDRLTGRDVWPLIPLFAIGLALGLTTAWVERRYVGAAGAEWNHTFLERCLVAGRAVWFYLGKLLVPWPLAFIYPRWQIDATVWWQYLYPAAAAAVVLYLWIARSRIGRGALVAVLFFVGTLGPALGFFDVFMMRYSFVSDHFQYLASIGLIALAAALLARGRDSILQSTCWAASPWAVRNRILTASSWALPVVLLSALGALTWRQATIYFDRESLWRDTLKKNPGGWLAHDNLGVLLCERGEIEAGIACYRRAMELKEAVPEVHLNLADALVRQGRLDEAIAHYRRGVELEPGISSGHYNLAKALALQGRTDEAIDHYRQALRRRPDDPNTLHNLGLLLMEKGQIEEAARHFITRLQSEPHDATAHIDLANAFAHQGRFDEAIEHYRQALLVTPESPEVHYNLAMALETFGRIDDAIDHYREALRLRSGYPDAHNNLGLALARKGRLDEAIVHFETAVRLEPRSAGMQSNLGSALADRGEHGPAIEHYIAALQIDPRLLLARMGLADALEHEGRIEDAVAQYREALRIEPENADIRQRLNTALARQGMPATAPAR